MLKNKQQPKAKIRSICLFSLIRAEKRPPVQNANQLPNEIRLKIFDYLEFDDLLLIEHANEDWTDIVALVIKSKVVVVNERNEDYESSYFSKEFLVSKSMLAFKKNIDLQFNIKELVLNRPLTLFNLKNFDNLTNLKITLDSNLKKVNQPIFFTLENLTDLTIEGFLNTNLVLETSKLSYLYVNDLSNIKIMFPHTIRWLNCSKSTSSINQFSYLEGLVCFRFFRVDNLFEDLKFLKSFSFFKSGISDLLSDIDYLESKQAINENLKVYYKRINLVSNPHQQNEIVNSNSFFLTDQDMQV